METTRVARGDLRQSVFIPLLSLSSDRRCWPRDRGLKSFRRLQAQLVQRAYRATCLGIALGMCKYKERAPRDGKGGNVFQYKLMGTTFVDLVREGNAGNSEMTFKNLDGNRQSQIACHELVYPTTEQSSHRG